MMFDGNMLKVLTDPCVLARKLDYPRPAMCPTQGDNNKVH